MFSGQCRRAVSERTPRRAPRPRRPGPPALHGPAFRHGLVAQFLRIAPEHLGQVLAVAIAEHRGHAPVHILLQIGLVAADGQRRGGKVEVVAPEQVLQPEPDRVAPDRLSRPYRCGEVFSSAVKSSYPIGIIGEHLLFPFSFRPHILQRVIKTKTDQLKLLRIPASPCRTIVQHSSKVQPATACLRLRSGAPQRSFRNHRSAPHDDARFAPAA